jgi:long-chain acyl-CoA synthetase
VEKLLRRLYEPGVKRNVSIPSSLTLPALLADSAHKYSEQTMTVFGGMQLTYSQVDSMVDMFAAGLQSLGIERGDRVVISLPTSPHFIISLFGILRYGAIAVPANPLLKGQDLLHILKDSGATVMIAMDQVVPLVSQIKTHTSLKSVIVTDLQEPLPQFAMHSDGMADDQQKAVNPHNADSSPVIPFASLLQNPGNYPDVELKATDIALLQYTGGTTGIPKGAILTHQNLVANVYQVEEWIINVKVQPEIFMCALPFFHVFGFTCTLTIPINRGATMILIPQFKPKSVLDAIGYYKATHFVGVPAYYATMGKVLASGEYDISSLKLCISGGDYLPAEIKAEFERLSPVKITSGYGSSESSGVSVARTVSGQVFADNVLGIPIPNTKIKVIDLETSKEAPSGGIGELVIKGPQIMQGYWGYTADGEDVFIDGYLRTGDLVFEKDGILHFVDRAKDMFNVAGENVYPSEVEKVLLSNPLIKEAVVFGKEHPIKGMVAVAAVILAAGAVIKEKELLSFARKEIATFKCSMVKIVDGEELPRTPLGKVSRALVKTLFQEPN